MVKDYEVEIVEIKEWTDGIKSIYLHVNDEFNFKAGQYVMLKDEINGKIVSRAYSIASSPKEEHVEILFRVVGLFTNHLNNLKVGSKLKMIGPFGHMTLDRANKNKIIFIATGTGISPHLSISKSLIEKCDKEITVIYGTRYKSAIAHYEDFIDMEKKCPKFHFIPVLSREKDNAIGERGHVQDILDKYIDTNSNYYICGLPAMTDEVVSMLKDKGIDIKDIFVERF